MHGIFSCEKEKQLQKTVNGNDGVVPTLQLLSPHVPPSAKHTYRTATNEGCSVPDLESLKVEVHLQAIFSPRSIMHGICNVKKQTQLQNESPSITKRK